MNIPKLRQQITIKKYHGISWEDNYAWIHQNDILEVLKDPNKLNPEVRKYLEENNKYTECHLKDAKKLQKKLFNEIKGRIKLNDESLVFTDKITIMLLTPFVIFLVFVFANHESKKNISIKIIIPTKNKFIY